MGKKVVYSTAFKSKNKNKAALYIPIFDEYKATFSACDKYNFVMHNKTYTHQNGGGGNHGFDSAVFDYCFTESLINAHHAFLVTRRIAPTPISFKNFTMQLAVDLVQMAQRWENTPIV